MRASATGTVDFENIAVTDDDILGTWDDYHRQPTFSGGAWRFAACSSAASRPSSTLGGDTLPRPAAAATRTSSPASAMEPMRSWAREGGSSAPPGSSPRTSSCLTRRRLRQPRTIGGGEAGLDVLQLAQRSVGLQGFLREHPWSGSRAT